MARRELDEPRLVESPSESEAAAFVRALVQWVGPGFHPDTDFHDYVTYETNARSYPSAQADRLNAKLDRAAAVLGQGEEDVYDVAAPVQHALISHLLSSASTVS